jgi:hypothetical protein
MILRRTRILVPLLAVSLALVTALAGPAVAESKTDKAILKAGVITKGDVPPDWTSKKSTSGAPDRSITECKEIRTAVENAKKKVPRTRSRQFQDPTSDAGAEDTVYAFRNVQAATGFVANYQGTAGQACFEKLAEKLAPSGTATVSPITDLEGVGDEALGYEIAYELTAAGQTATAYVDFVVVRTGRAVVGFGFTNRGERIPEGPPIVRAVVSRVSAVKA